MNNLMARVSAKENISGFCWPTDCFLNFSGDLIPEIMQTSSVVGKCDLDVLYAYISMCQI